MADRVRGSAAERATHAVAVIAGTRLRMRLREAGHDPVSVTNLDGAAVAVGCSRCRERWPLDVVEVQPCRG